MFTFFNDVKGAQSQIDFFLCNDKNAVSYYDTLDDGCILSDHVPITVECAITASICSCTPEPVDMALHSQATVSQLRWDHANISLYRDLTGLYLQPILQHLNVMRRWLSRASLTRQWRRRLMPVHYHRSDALGFHESESAVDRHETG